LYTQDKSFTLVDSDAMILSSEKPIFCHTYAVAELETLGNRKHAVIAFRGTDNTGDVWTDANVRKTYFEGGGYVHSGFHKPADLLPLDIVYSLLNDGYHVWFTGHSLGGSVASVLTARVLLNVNNNQKMNIKCVTFGAPLYGDTDFATTMQHFENHFHHFTNENDPVPQSLIFFNELVTVLRELSIKSEAKNATKEKSDNWIQKVSGVIEDYGDRLTLLGKCAAKAVARHTSFYAPFGRIYYISDINMVPEIVRITHNDFESRCMAHEKRLIIEEIHQQLQSRNNIDLGFIIDRYQGMNIDFSKHKLSSYRQALEKRLKVSLNYNMVNHCNLFHPQAQAEIELSHGTDCVIVNVRLKGSNLMTCEFLSFENKLVPVKHKGKDNATFAFEIPYYQSKEGGFTIYTHFNTLHYEVALDVLSIDIFANMRVSELYLNAAHYTLDKESTNDESKHRVSEILTELDEMCPDKRDEQITEQEYSNALETLGCITKTTFSVDPDPSMRFRSAQTAANLIVFALKIEKNLQLRLKGTIYGYSETAYRTSLKKSLKSIGHESSEEIYLLLEANWWKLHSSNSLGLWQRYFKENDTQFVYFSEAVCLLCELRTILAAERAREAIDKQEEEAQAQRDIFMEETAGAVSVWDLVSSIWK
jgi:hypothetical protein